MPIDESRKGLLYALLAYGLWGTFPIYFKWVSHLPSLEVLGHRVVWATLFTALVMTLLGQWRRRREQLLNRRLWLTLLISAILIAANWGIYIYAVQINQVLSASLGYFMTPLVNVVIGVALLGEKLDRFRMMAVVLAVLGVAYQVISLGQLPWIALSLAILFGLYSAVRKKAPVDTLTGLLMETLLLLPLALGYLAFIAQQGESHFTADGNPSRLILVGVLTALPLLAFAAAAQRLSLIALGFLTYLAPSIQFLLAVVVYDEPFGGDQMISFLLIWAGLAVFSVGALQQQHRARKQRLAAAG
ncbi:EamA family transporter RarD [Marinobacterium arenosum]|uniref:EamA family transporter RarD n=1 Tax=Marinobacterium arenosum TaxID=2862496 RepID=UPI001C9793FF|nr:EamA family transporter RarD [Marinobacterium arenosum]MBY4677115.1 EamA family transporter RarD [Marinobacterium arenosum]